MDATRITGWRRRGAHQNTRTPGNAHTNERGHTHTDDVHALTIFARVLSVRRRARSAKPRVWTLRRRTRTLALFCANGWLRSEQSLRLMGSICPVSGGWRVTGKTQHLMNVYINPCLTFMTLALLSRLKLLLRIFSAWACAQTVFQCLPPIPVQSSHKQSVQDGWVAHRNTV